MIGDPGAVAFTHNGRNQMYAFVRGNGGGLQDCFWNAAPDITSWQWDNRGTIPGGVALTTSPSPVASRSDASAPEASLHIFAGGDDNAMHECYWDGVAWRGWVNRGSPANTPIQNRPSVANILAWVGEDDEASSYYEVLGFTWSQDMLWRYSRRFDRWSALSEVGKVVGSNPAAIVENLGNSYYVLCYYVGGDRTLYATVMTDRQGLQWATHDLGRPGPGLGIAYLIRPGLAQPEKFTAVVIGEDSKLWGHSWGGIFDQTRGGWTVLGLPSDGVSVLGEVSPVVFSYEGSYYVYSFFRGSDRHLYEVRWDGKDNAVWDDFGMPTTGGVSIPASPNGGDAPLVSAPSAIRFDDQSDGLTKIYAFVIADDGHLHVCFWDGNTWRWNDLGPDPED